MLLVRGTRLKEIASDRMRRSAEHLDRAELHGLWTCARSRTLG